MKTRRELEELSAELGIGARWLLREELQKLCLRHLAERQFFSTGVFQGGTAIRLFYDGARFSEDLDFVVRRRNDPVFSGIEGKLKGLPAFVRRQVPFVGEVTLEERKVSPRGFTPTH